MSKGNRSQAQRPQSKTENSSRQTHSAEEQASTAEAVFQTVAAGANHVNPLSVETLHQNIGNKAVGGMVTDIQRTSGRERIQRSWWDTLFGEDEDTESEEEEAVDPEQAALQEFLARDMIPNEEGENVIGAAGMGGFNAKFDTANRRLIVTVNIGVNFHHALAVEPTSGLVTPEVGGLATGDTAELTNLLNAATQIMSTMPNVADRVAEVNASWRWSAAEEEPWMQQYRNAVESAWSGQHAFQSSRWPDLQASVAVQLNVHKGDQDGDHCSSRILKTPPGAIGAYVSPGTNRATDQGLFMSSSGVGPNATNFLRYQLRFENGEYDLGHSQGTMHSNDAGADYLDKFIADFQAGDPTQGTPIQVIGRANAVGDANENRILSENRARAVADYLSSNGLTGSINRVSNAGEGDVGATEDPSWRRVDIIVGSGEAQNTAAHEFGHMIGLGDEYASPAGGFFPGAGTPIPIGSPSDHDALASAMGGGVTGAVGENSDSIMSVGNTVRPQHYATFHNALVRVTGETWTYAGP